MAINTLAAATLFMTMLDKVAVQEATTGWMDANAGRVIYNGGNEVKILQTDAFICALDSPLIHSCIQH